MCAVTLVEECRIAQACGHFQRIERDLRKVGLDPSPLALVDVFPKAGVPASEVADHVSDIPTVRHAASWKGAKRNPDILQIQPRTLEDPPVEERGRQVGQYAVAKGASEHQHLRSDRRDGETTDSLFPQDRPRALGRPRESAFGSLPLDAGLRGDGEPSVDEFLRLHPEPVVPEHEQSLATVVVDLHVIGVRVVRVLEQFAGRCGDAGDLLSTQHVQRPGPDLETHFHRCQLTPTLARCFST